MKMDRRFLWRFLWAALMVLLAGCANTAAKRTATGLELDMTTGASEGLVVIRVVSLRPVSTLNPKWQQIHLKSGERHAEIVDVTPPSNAFFQGRYFATESLYFAKLSAGEYEITGFGSLGPGPGLIPAVIASDSAQASGLPSFSIKAGRLANLGTLVFAPKLGDAEPAQMVLLRGPMGRKSASDALLAESRPGQLEMPAGGGWSGHDAPEEELKLLSRARMLASHLYLRVGSEGLAGGSNLGQVLWHSGANQWKREFLDTLGAVFAVSRTTDGLTVAGSEYGTYFVKSNLGTWRPGRLPGENGRVVYIEPLGAHGAMMIASSAKGIRLWVHDSPGDPAVIPKEMAALNASPEFLLSSASEWIIPFNLPGMFREVEIKHVAKNSFTVTSQKQDFWVRQWQLLHGGTIMMTRQNGTSFYRSKSADRGQSWVHEKNPSGASNYWMDERHAYSLEYETGFSTMTNKLQKTVDGGASWTNLGAPLVTPSFAGTIVYADNSEILVQVLGLVYSTLDEGKTWRRVFPPQP